MSNTHKTLLKKVLLRKGGKGKLWAAMLAVFAGNVLLLASVMVWWNFNELLYGKDQPDSLGSTFVIIGKKVTNTNLGIKGATLFTQPDIDTLSATDQVQAVGAISSNHFPVYAVLGGELAMATDLPLEAVPDSFLDKIPGDWKWQPGQRDLPIIMSSQFLDLYNYVFAPSQGLPQLSESSVKSIALTVKAGPVDNAEMYTAHVVGFSDRINSVMVPQSFINYGNEKFARAGDHKKASQLILKVKDPSDKRFTDFINKRNYTTNSQNLRWSKMREIVEVVTSVTGLLAVLLTGIGALVFVLFIELTIVKAADALTLLKQLGYSPASLSKFMLGRFMPLVGLLATLSTVTAILGQYAASMLAKNKGLFLHAFPGIPVWATLVVSTCILTAMVSVAIRRAIGK